MFIINQDRDRIIHMKKSATLYTLPAIYNKKFFGINLFYGDISKASPKCRTLLGTFDSVAEALHEIQRIESNVSPVYWVSGYRGGTLKPIHGKMLEDSNYELD